MGSRGRGAYTRDWVAAEGSGSGRAGGSCRDIQGGPPDIGSTGRRPGGEMGAAPNPWRW